MNSEEYKQWRTRRGDEPGSWVLVGMYIRDAYPSDERRAREVEFVEEVEAEAKEVYEERGPAGLEKERALIDDHVGDQEEQFQRVHLHQSGFELIASQIRLSYSDCAGRVVEDLEVVPRGAFVRDPDGPDGLEGLQAPEGPLVLRPSGETYRLEPTVRLLEGYDMPTDVLRWYSFGLLQLTDGDTWEEAAAMVEEQVEFTKEATQKARRELHFLQARRDVYDALLERRAKGKDMPWENAQGVAQQSRGGRPSRLENPDEVLETLDTVCEWLDTDPPPTFKGDGGLVNFATDKFAHLTDAGTRDRIRQTFDQLAREYTDLPTPDLDTGTNGHKYLETEEQIRRLREEYAARFDEKPSGTVFR